jgi:hypothetical protein
MTKLQISTSKQHPMTEIPRSKQTGAKGFASCDLEFVWSLVLAIWDFLGLGACDLVLPS